MKYLIGKIFFLEIRNKILNISWIIFVFLKQEYIFLRFFHLHINHKYDFLVLRNAFLKQEIKFLT